jgi:cysteine-rich repeat protein
LLALRPLLPALPLLAVACLRPLPNDTSDTGSSSTDTSDSSSTPDTSSSPTSGFSSSSDDTSSTTSTSPPPCDDDPACGPDETVESCPEQCNVCGDGVVFGDETCDNGPDNLTYWPSTPPDGACSQTCDAAFSFCGDGFLDPSETCDNGQANLTYWPSTPPDGACSQTCDAAFSFCGDGFLDPPEACDDANNEPFSGCSDTCTAECLLFVTSAAFPGDFGGLDPDLLCQDAAASQNLFGHYLAWLSFPDAHAALRLSPCTSPVLRRDGTVISQDWPSFTSDSHAAPIDLSEAALPPNIMNTGGAVWTGSLPDGSLDAYHCDAWTSTDPQLFGSVGNIGATNASWTSQSPLFCNKLAHLYCLQQPL